MRGLILPALLVCLSAACAPTRATGDGSAVPVPAEDGAFVLAQRGAQTVVKNSQGAPIQSAFLYYRAAQPHPGHPVWVVVRYWDGGPGAGITLSYDSTVGEGINARYRGADQQVGGWRAGTGQWQSAIFALAKPRFEQGQNGGADFRLHGTGLEIADVRIVAARPTEWDAVAARRPPPLPVRVKIGTGGQLIVGGFDPTDQASSITQSQALALAAPSLKSVGVTSHEGYVRWNLCEPTEGHYDWSVYDRFVEVYRRAGLKWVPFLIVGSPYSLPDWYYKKPGSQGYICLEHGLETDVQSLWNPAMRGHVGRFIDAFCRHYGKTGIIESILLGVTGNYGEAIYPASGSDWTGSVHGAYHSHAGFWAGDPFAVKSFRAWLMRKYASDAALQAAWKSSSIQRAAAAPFLRANAPSDRAWLDFTSWYIDSMTEWASFWMQRTRQAYPSGNIYLCTGGDAPPEHGSDFGDQCRIAAAVHGGVRITNEGSDYRANFSLTRWIASAARQYGAYFSFEPASGVDANGITGRVYNATASGARGLHYYFPNLTDSPQAFENLARYGNFFEQHAPKVEIAVYYPETYIRLHGNHFLGAVQPLRDRFDFDYKSDGQIADGGLNSVRALVMLDGNQAEASTWKTIATWVRKGGVLLYPDAIGPLQTIEGDTSVYESLFGPTPNTGAGKVLRFAGSGRSAAYREWAARTLAAEPALSMESRAMLRLDGKEDGIFATVTAPNTLLWLNTTDTEFRPSGSAAVPPHGIAAQTLER